MRARHGHRAKGPARRYLEPLSGPYGQVRFTAGLCAADELTRPSTSAEPGPAPRGTRRVPS